MAEVCSFANDIYRQFDPMDHNHNDEASQCTSHTPFHLTLFFTHSLKSMQRGAWVERLTTRDSRLKTSPICPHCEKATTTHLTSRSDCRHWFHWFGVMFERCVLNRGADGRRFRVAVEAYGFVALSVEMMFISIHHNGSTRSRPVRPDLDPSTLYQWFFSVRRIRKSRDFNGQQR